MNSRFFDVFLNSSDDCAFTVGQICAGHKNDLVLEINGGEASLRWHQERQNDLERRQVLVDQCCSSRLKISASSTLP